MTIAQVAAPRFEMGRVIKRTLSILRSNISAFTLLSIVPGLSSAAATVAGNQIEADLGTLRFPDANTIIVVAAWNLIYLVSAVLLQGAVTHATVASLNGKQASVGECLSTGLKYLWPMSLIGLVGTIAIVAGLAALIAPGILLIVMWFVVGPACIVEHAGVRESFRRSADLTRGYRWPIFGLLAALIVAVLAFTFIVGLVLALVATADVRVAEMVGNLISAMLFLTVGSALGAATYYELRKIKEGIGPEALASVFE